MKTLIIYKSIHLGSTGKIAEAMGKAMKAELIEPKDFDPADLADYDLLGFGSGIYDGGFHKSILNLIGKIPDFNSKGVFLFSTAGVIYDKSHRKIREMLLSKNAVIIDEFQCRGLNKNSFLKYIGGMNKGRPNAVDIKNAEQFSLAVLNARL